MVRSRGLGRDKGGERGRGTRGGRGRGARGDSTQGELDFRQTRVRSGTSDDTSSTPAATGFDATTSTAGLHPATPAGFAGYGLPAREVPPPAHVPPAEDVEMEEEEEEEDDDDEGDDAGNGRGPARTKVPFRDDENARFEVTLGPKMTIRPVNPTVDVDNASKINKEIARLVEWRNEGKYKEFADQCRPEAFGGEGDASWKFFSKKFRWAKAIEDAIKRAFYAIAHRRLSQSFARVRKKAERPKWILEEHYPELLDYWQNNPKFLNRSKKAKENRAKGPYLPHGHGSMSGETFEEKYRENYRKQHGREPDAVTVIEAMKRRANGETIPGWEEPLEQLRGNHTAELGPDRVNWPPVPTPKLWIQPKKGRVAGQGNTPASLFGFPPPRRMTTGIHINVGVEPTPQERAQQEKDRTLLQMMREEMERNNADFARRARRAEQRIDSRWVPRDGRGSSSQNFDDADRGRRLEDLDRVCADIVEEEEEDGEDDPMDYLRDPTDGGWNNGPGGGGTPDLGGI